MHVHVYFAYHIVVPRRVTTKEPLLLPRGTANVPPPVYLTTREQGVRFHVKAKHLGDDIRTSVEGTRRSVDRFVSGLMGGRGSAAAAANNKSAKRDGGVDLFGVDPSELAFPLAGGSSETTNGRGSGRLDFQLQPNLIDNEYISAVAAHSSYWSNGDVVDYFLDLTAAATTPRGFGGGGGTIERRPDE